VVLTEGKKTSASHPLPRFLGRIRASSTFIGPAANDSLQAVAIRPAAAVYSVSSKLALPISAIKVGMIATTTE
jgi:hypothetical protein